MKLVWVGIALLVGIVGITVGCGPKEKFCYQEGKTCSDVAGDMAQEALEVPDADASDDAPCTMPSSETGLPVPCNPG